MGYLEAGGGLRWIQRGRNGPMLELRLTEMQRSDEREPFGGERCETIAVDILSNMQWWTLAMLVTLTTSQLRSAPCLDV